MPYMMDFEVRARREEREAERETSRRRLAGTIVRQAQKFLRVREVPQGLVAGVERLGMEELERLSEDLLDFEGLRDLVRWLWLSEQRVRPELVGVVLEGLFGQLGEELRAPVAGLSVEQVEALSREVLDWSGGEALRDWLELQAETPGRI